MTVSELHRPAPAPRPEPLARGRRVRPDARILAGGGLVLVVVLAGLAAPWLAPYGPLEQIRGANLVGASAQHWFGTDEVNRDVFSRTLFGIRTNLAIVVPAVLVGAALGTLLGLLATTHRALDTLTQRAFDVVLAFPALILAIALAAAFGPGATTVAVVIAVVEVPLFGRLVRSSVLSIRERPYVEAAEVIGASRRWVLRRHVLPNSLEPLGVQLALSLSTAVFVEGAMSFIGIGVRPPDPSLGAIVSGAVPNMDANPFYAIGPLAVVAALVLGFLLVSQGISRTRRS
ncbi:ABC transporter permease [Rhodococcus rhodnii]|uniref:ABC transporter permease n=1 Tax=Rhodococcus rhodnii TaxID=38312 RepID=A0A6P2CH14_9NOCA|nr:ABC transporter permease [Rhodococcus rhodnii]TXG91220.1 ABC transporter permease [Rhodococcus rhodnii]